MRESTAEQTGNGSFNRYMVECELCTLYQECDGRI